MAFLYCADNNVIDLLIVSAKSLRKFTDEKIVVFGNGIKIENKNKIENNISNIVIMDVSEIIEGRISDSDKIDRKITKTSMAWILAAELIPSEGKIAVLDCDTFVVNGEVKNYKNIDMNGKTFAAVPEKISSFSFKKRYQYDWLNRTNLGFYEHAKTLGFNIVEYDDYVNSGFLIVDLELMNSNKYIEKMLHWHENNLERLFNDQDILNAVAKGDIHLLDFNWNYCKPTFGTYSPYLDLDEFKSLSKKAYIIHYAGKYAKPISDKWDGTYPFKDEYLKVYESIIRSK